MKKEMLINVMQPEECRIAIIEDGVLEELYVERTSHESYVGNIYKGRIVNIEPSIQAAFVDFGVGRNGFLHVSDVEPAYYRDLEPRRNEGGRDRGRGRSGAGPRPEEPSVTGPEPATAPPEVEEATATPPPPVGESEAAAAVPSPQPRGTRGGRSRRGRRGGSRAAATAEASAESAATGEAAATSPTSETPGEPLTPPDTPDATVRFMESAERVTGDESEQKPSADDLSPIADEDVFFPRPEAATVSAAPPAYAEPQPIFDDEPPSAEAQPDAAGDTTVELGTEATGDDQDETLLDEEDLEERLANYIEGTGEPGRRRPRREDRGRNRRRGHNGRPGSGRPKPLIQDIFRRGQEVLVQVIKEGIGTKGPTLSTYISIPGRYLVLMPGLNRVGVSRKITDDEQRRRLREIFQELQPPKGLGFIIRTAGIDKNKKELQNDLAYLTRLWQVVVRRIRKSKAPAEIYQESDMITRTIRDIFTSDIDTIWVDEPNAFEHAREFLQIVMPRYANRIKLYEGPEPIFHKYGIEEEISRIQQRHVPLPNGGSIVIDQTEALVAIDVNSGNFRADNNAEETAYQMNLLAAKEIARQLRLRDLGGVIVNDFIDMREEKHRRGVERALREAVKRDRARTKILKISAFGIIEMTRQRIRPSLKRSVFQDCPYCRSTGQVKTTESMSIEVMRLLQLAAHRDNVHRIEVAVAADVAHYLQNKKRKEINRLEEARNIQVVITGRTGVSPETLEFLCYDNNNNEVKCLPYDDSKNARRR
ncbi:MAG: Rne/Rng family ribonuclease [Gemmataceae bacterium]|nr:Rne/Rng family ribonuclease [Gemmataceae bacterium]MDW8266241.1 Rne/Rng family ribonuclease [Gemmataceae bacterium]